MWLILGGSRLLASEAPWFADIDANGLVEADTDGLLSLRYAFGFCGQTLLAEAVDRHHCGRYDDLAVAEYIDHHRAFFDVDGNGGFDALTDGILLNRYLRGTRGDALIRGAVDQRGCSRCTSTEISDYFATHAAFDCTENNAFCPQVDIAGASESPSRVWTGSVSWLCRSHPASKSTIQYAMAGLFLAEKIVHYDRLGRRWLVGGVDLHLAKSEDRGQHFTFLEPLFTTQAMVDPGICGINGFVSNKVATLAPRQTPDDVIWYLGRLVYFLEPGTILHKFRTDSIQLRIATAERPEWLNETTDEAILGTVFTRAKWGAPPALTISIRGWRIAIGSTNRPCSGRTMPCTMHFYAWSLISITKNRSMSDIVSS